MYSFLIIILPFKNKFISKYYFFYLEIYDQSLKYVSLIFFYKTHISHYYEI